MVSQIQSPSQPEVIYPDSDGQPVANNTIQFRWLVEIQQNLDWLFADDPNVFVAGDLFWYPVEGRNTIVNAPDVLVVFGRPKGDRLSYLQWKEGGIPPQVVFEIISPSNTQNEMDKKLLFYDRYGVEEYYIYDPAKNSLRGWIRGEDGLDVIPQMTDWVSPRLTIRFVLDEDTLQLFRPDGERFVSYNEISQRFEQERQRAEQERQRAEQAEQARRDAVPQLLQMNLSIEQIAQALRLSVEEVQAIVRE
ncbi:Uma2 family endonuclease [Nostocaceae cyanobacterium CENA369]|uniref:Uma2 family endonuclease n=1 Tax=Dendronalium phyllosphericum CENA369 TaxID=1725256 RepID=A0A8J7I8B5_9NOST|nr:Uma2 family endonuclease [Dendronalium phyllosphericum]MBH8574332.1 Uma2 family endonuclease [Dendronalium phyllosphericum CENA369]